MFSKKCSPTEPCPFNLGQKNKEWNVYDSDRSDVYVTGVQAFPIGAAIDANTALRPFPEGGFPWSNIVDSVLSDVVVAV